MKVFIVRAHYDYEGFSDLAIYKEKVSAENHLNDLNTCLKKMRNDQDWEKWRTRVSDIGSSADRYYIKEMDILDEYICPWSKTK